MASAFPAVVNWLLTTVPTLSGWSSVVVVDGPPVEAIVPNDYLTVGFVDGSGNDATFSLTPADDGFSVEESGTIRCRLACVTEQMDPSGMRERVFGLFDAVAAAVKADRRLGGVLSPQGTVTLVVDPEVIVNATGASQALVFSLVYTTIT